MADSLILQPCISLTATAYFLSFTNIDVCFSVTVFVCMVIIEEGNNRERETKATKISELSRLLGGYAKQTWFR